MPWMNFDLQDGKPPVGFNLKPEDCDRFVKFMAECNAALQSQAREPLAWLYEDTLPPEYPYDAMHPHSRVDGVRMFPVFGPPAADKLREAAQGGE